MPYRAWLLVIAVGLTAGSGQAQEQTDSAERQADAQQVPAQPYPLPFPVDIIEDDAAAEARERREEETRQREIADLAAQEGMNAATQAMNDATQRMAEYSFWSTVFVAIGTGLLIVTLWLTRKANEAAIAAVQTERAWVLYRNTEHANLVNSTTTMDGRLRQHANSLAFIVKFSNVGRSPALDVAMHVAHQLIDCGNEVPEFRWREHSPDAPRSVMSPNDVIDNMVALTDEETAAVRSRERRLILFARIEYWDVFQRRDVDLSRVTELRIEARHSGGTFERDGKRGEAITYAPVGNKNRAT